ncbi:hypothetical protein GOP47_0018927 [Adiantum capillus-veneris]|uniref:Tyrosyl-DNA phosphodiesterase 1 n=1 Tax=Adiantum capillus-veneris TaxID=13818 RepID=A0A9D4UF25_ADICA|nr:hypothetical protein GOP47_0018927 [Adiantum capillus-veneris]
MSSKVGTLSGRLLCRASMLQHGVLVPINDASSESYPCQPINLYEGFNTVGRSDLAAASKQVSRKHISIHASSGMFQVTVEGQNPIVLKKGTERHELKHQEKASIFAGDIVELLPGKHAFQLTVSSSNNDEAMVNAEEQKVLVKRKRQELEDESLARALQAIEDEGAQVSCVRRESISKAVNSSNPALSSEISYKRHKFTHGHYPRTFQLLKVKGLPSWANSTCLSIQDVIEGDILFALLSNYMIDLDWLLSGCPLLNHVPQVAVVHGESGASLDRLKAGKPANWLLHKPPLPLSYGTHHSKAMVLVYQTGVRVIVHTANLIYVDWNNKTQGLWMQDFPYKDEQSEGSVSPFEEDFVEYLEALQWNGCSIHLPVKGMTRINAAFFRNYDYSMAKVRLIASVPGYHQGQKLRKWGHMKLRAILEQQKFDERFIKSPLVYQFSSLGSLDEKWLSEFGNSTSSGLSAHGKSLGPGNVQILWPTVEDVRCSIEGYAAGNAIPSPLKNVEKDFLRRCWARWSADHSGRSRAMPHFKSYVRHNGQDLAWFLLTSSNLSKAAWGALQKNGSQLMIRSYELGVLFLPSLQDTQVSFSCTGSMKEGESSVKETREGPAEQRFRFATTCCERDNEEVEATNVLKFPVPYKLPLERYGAEDVPWSWDRQYLKPDTCGEVWPRAVKLYGTKQDA